MIVNDNDEKKIFSMLYDISSYTNIKDTLVELFDEVTNILQYKKVKEKLQKDDEEHISLLIREYTKRVHNYICFCKHIKNENLKDHIYNNLAFLCYDELVTLYLMAFSIFETLYKNALDYIFCNYLIKNNLLKEKYVNLHIKFDVSMGRRLFSQYDFPKILSITLNGTPNLIELYKEINDIDDNEKAKQEIEILTESFMYLMVYRNQYAHMSKKTQMFSSEKIYSYFEQLIKYFERTQITLLIITKLFNEMASICQ